MKKQRRITCRTRQWIRHQWLCGREWLECHYCGKRLSFADITLDHVKPLSKGGSNYISNLLPACECCNAKKRDRPYGDFIKGIAA